MSSGSRISDRLICETEITEGQTYLIFAKFISVLPVHHLDSMLSAVVVRTAFCPVATLPQTNKLHVPEAVWGCCQELMCLTVMKSLMSLKLLKYHVL